MHRIDEQTLLLQGQELNIDAKQPDVAKAVVHRTGDTVVIVDTGVTEAFRKALRDSRLLHLGDEDNRPCGSMPDADQVKVQSAFGLAASLIDSGSVQTITDGHGSLHRDAQPGVHRDDRCQRARRSGLDGAAERYHLDRPALKNPAPVTGKPQGLAIIPAAAEMLPLETAPQVRLSTDPAIRRTLDQHDR